MERTPEELGQVLRKVREVYQWHNDGLFGGALRLPLLEWSESEGQLGSFQLEGRVLRLSVTLLRQPWGALVEVLKHEMAHQFVLEVLAVHDEGPHGPAFQRVCRERGIDPGTRGLPRVDQEDWPEETRRIKQRIQGLLALSASANEHEAELAMTTARRLMLKYNLQASAEASADGYTFLHLGTPTGRRMAWQRVLANILSEHFFVEIIIVPVYRPDEDKRGSVLEACGTRENLAIASYVHDFLERAATSAWDRHRRALGLRSSRQRQSYLYGLMCGFRDKLDRESEKHRREGLVWVGDPSLAKFFRRRHPHVRHVGRSARVHAEAFSAGHEAGGRIVLHRGMEAGRNESALRLLGAGEKG